MLLALYAGLAAGGVRWRSRLLLTAALLLLFGHSLNAVGGSKLQSRIEIRFRLATPAQLPEGWTLLATPDTEELAVQRVTVSGNKPVTLTLPSGSRWQLSAELPGYWVRRLPLSVAAAAPSSQPAVVVLDLWPLGTLRGTVDLAEKKGSLPERLLVTTVSAPKVVGRPPMPAGVVPCSILREGRWKGSWSCSLPAGKLDLAISAEGFVPQYLWGVEVAPLAQRTAPAIQLERGASIAGWVAVEGGKIDPESCVARLTPAADCRSDLGEALKLTATVSETKVGGDGFLQFTAVAPGTYALSVVQPGYAAATVDLIRVSPKEETFLEQPLVLTAPLTLRLQIDPALDPNQQPWKVTIHTSASKAANGGRMGLAHAGPADRQGQLVVTDLSPGEIRVQVEDSEGNRAFTTGTSHWSLETSMSRRIEIPRIQIEGQIHLGEEPLAATLWFGGRSGSLRARLESDEEGRFSGILPQEGFWRLQVTAEKPKLETWLATQVDKPSKGAARLVLRLPDTRLFGRVVDFDGAPLVRGSVNALGRSHSTIQRATTDSSGRFEFRGLAEGKTALAGESRSGCQTGKVLVTLAEGEEVGPIELRCRKQKRITGTVTGRRGPVGAARVRLVGAGAQLGGGEATTGADGGFSVTMPTNVVRAVAHVAAPGYGYRPVRVTLGEEPLHLRVEEEAGIVEIVRPGDEDSLMSRDLRLVLFRGGLEVHTNLTGFNSSQEVDGQLGWYRIPGLAPGEFTACILGPAPTPGMAPAMAESSACDSGQLTAGARLRLSPQPPD